MMIFLDMGYLMRVVSAEKRTWLRDSQPSALSPQLPPPRQRSAAGSCSGPIAAGVIASVT